MDYPEWLIGSWVTERNDIWTFDDDGTYNHGGTNGTYVVIEKVLAIANSYSSTSYDMIVSKDNRVLILRAWNGGSKVLRKK